MTTFIQIDNLLINLAHIISAQFIPAEPGSNDTQLDIVTTEMELNVLSSTNVHVHLHGDAAERAWDSLGEW